MAEVTSGTPTNPLTVIVLDAIEVDRLIGLLQRKPLQCDPHLSGLLDALTMDDGLCDECGHEPGDATDPERWGLSRCRCECHA